MIYFRFFCDYSFYILYNNYDQLHIKLSDDGIVFVSKVIIIGVPPLFYVFLLYVNQLLLLMNSVFYKSCGFFIKFFSR